MVTPIGVRGAKDDYFIAFVMVAQLAVSASRPRDFDAALRLGGLKLLDRFLLFTGAGLPF